MDKEQLKFEIDQLRKDKIIYAAEACATILICFLGFMFSSAYFHDGVRDAVDIVLLIISIVYTLFMGVGNFIRLQKIIRLEQELRK